MVHHCFICKSRKLDYPNLSYHRFPTNKEKRQEWVTGLGLKFDTNIPKYAMVCSEHFDSNDFFYGLCGRKYINKNATPKYRILEYATESSILIDMTNRSGPCSVKDEDSESTLSNVESIPDEVEEDKVTISTLCSETLETPAVENIVDFSSSTMIVPTAEEALMRMFNRDPKSLAEDSIDPLTEFRDSLKLLQQTRKRKRSMKRKYVGDLSRDDFDNFQKKRNLKFVKEIHKRRQKKVHALQDTFRKITKRITNLKNLLTYLKSESMISESLEASLKASLDGPSDIFDIR